MFMFDITKSIVQKIEIQGLKDRGIDVYIKRDDLIHNQVSGNKWRKLKYNVEMFQSLKKKGILTFGGAFSNHLLATAATCAELKIQSVGIVRGDELNVESNDTLRNCHELGMKLRFVSREDYSQRNEKSYQEILALEFENYLVVPEGGANYYGMIGCQEIMNEVKLKMNHIFVAQGTTTTSCGILMSLKEDQQLHVVPVLKGFDSETEMKALFSSTVLEKEWTESLFNNLVVHGDYHFGGYGKYTDELMYFIKDFYKSHQVKLDPVYTGKAMYAMLQELKSPEYNNTNVLFIHTGGIQGAQSIIDKTGIELY